MTLAKDIMSSPAISIREDQSVKEALDLLARHKISGLPVVDDDGKIVGIISNTDVIRYSQQKNVISQHSASFWVSPYTDMDDIASIRKGFEMLHRTRVDQLMTRKVYSTSEETSATDVAKLMNRRNVNRIPVVDASKKLVGIITRADMVKCMANL